MSYPYGHGGGFPGGDNFSTPSTPHDAFPVWDTIEGEQEHQQQQQQHTSQSSSQPQQQPQQQHQPMIPSDLHSPLATTPNVYPRTIQIDDPPVVPSHGNDDSVRLHPVHSDPSSQTQPGGLLRSGRAQHHQAQQQVHPYRRPSTSTSATTAAGNPRHLALQQHHQGQLFSQPQPREQHVHFAPVMMGRPPSGGMGVASAIPSSSSARASPLVPSPTGRITSFGSSSGSPIGLNLPESSLALTSPQGMAPPQSFAGSSSTPITTPKPQYASQADQSGSKRPYIIRMDTHYDTETHVLTALLEVPGVKRENLTVRLSTCSFNRVRQITINGAVQPPFGIPSFGNPRAAAASEKANTKMSVRERKYGPFARVIPVPSDLKREDIEAQLQDGILVLKFPCGMPAESDEEEDVSVN